MTPQLHFPPENDTFYSTLSARVKNYFDESGISRYANPVFFFKAALLLALHLLFYCFYLFSKNQSLALLSMVLMGPTSILIGINVAHDAAHGVISKNRKVNSAFLSLLDLLGANSYMWKKRHVFSHHLFPNIQDHDSDLKQNPLIRIFPGDEYRWYHRFQHLYAPFLYLFYTMHWLLFRDFKDFFQTGQNKENAAAHPAHQILKLLFFKLFYLSYIILLPLYFSSLTATQIITGYLLMNFAASVVITLALIPSHVAEASNFPLPNHNGTMPHSWSHHQVHTVIDFATTNPFLNFFFGGFNHHLAHHLFPGICHIHYPPVTKIVKQTVLEFGMTYQHEDSFLNAYLSHYKLLKNNSQVTLSKVSA